MLTRRLTKPLAVGAAVIAIAGGAAYGMTGATSSKSTTGATSGQPAMRGFAAKGGSNARSGPAAGGVAGTVSSVSTPTFTVSTAAGQRVTVKEAPSTTYANGAKAASKRAVTKAAPVLVLGTANGTTITATRVDVHPAGGASATYSPSKVVPFQRGAPSTAEQDGKIPANYTEGSGTIVSGRSANRATTAALAAYPGGVVDRVVRLGNGEYEAHNIGVNWPHHIFVSKSFKVVGAD
jgi:hypothetical protein